MENKAIFAKNILKKYNSQFTLNVDEFSATYGKVYGFYGPNGSGKTTFMKILSLIIPADSGDIYIDNKKADMGAVEIKRKLSFLFQEPKLLRRSIKGNLIYPLKIRNEKISIKKIEEMLEKLDIQPDNFLNKKPWELSGGEKKRVSLAQKLIFDPEIIFLDEPTANIDEKSVAIISDIVQDLKMRQKCVIVSSHDYEWLSKVADELYFTKKGVLAKREKDTTLLSY
jgi:tungstate transport system ATP-binding protein